MTRKKLWQIYDEHTGKSSHKWSLYLDEYDRLFSSLYDKSVRLLEIGIQNGGSLDIWLKYFEDAEIIIGCDVNPRCAGLSYADPRINVVVGDANEEEVAEKILSFSPQFDIVIDDGSHQSGDIIKSFIRYFPYLVDGGFFIVEDLHCSYWQQFEGGLFDAYSSMTFFKRLVDILNFEHWGVQKQRLDILAGIAEKYGIEIDENELSRIHSIEFVNSMCIVRRAPIKNNDIGRNVVAGDIESVVQGNLALHGLPYSLDPLFIQEDNPSSMLPLPPEELLIEREKELADSRHVLAITKQEMMSFESELNRLGSSKSWRFTAPLRWLASKARAFLKKI